jgi:hypothetical protein
MSRLFLLNSKMKMGKDPKESIKEIALASIAPAWTATAMYRADGKSRWTSAPD